MDIFYISADMSHLLAIFILIANMWKSKSCSGVSAKSQVLYALVFTFRYLDLFTFYLSFCNTAKKIVFLIAIYATLYLILFKFRKTYMHESDTFRVELIVIPSAILALLINHMFEPTEILWTFSIYLDAVAILPQIFMIRSTGSAEVITAHYVFALGAYHVLNIVSYPYAYYTIDWFCPITVVAGIVQTIPYVAFVYFYVTRVVQGKDSVMPIKMDPYPTTTPNL